MTVALNKVVHLHRRVPQLALERLNRLTGLQFSNWPESLVRSAEAAASRPSLRIERCDIGH